MRAAPVTWTNESSVAYASIDYARVVISHGQIVVVNDADEDETARQHLIAPNGPAILGIGPNASCTRAATAALRERGIRALSTSGATDRVEPFEDVELAHMQAKAFYLPAANANAARRLYASRFVDSPLTDSAPVDRLRSVDAGLTHETYAKFVKRFAVKRFTRHPGGTDSVNVALTIAERATLDVAADVCRVLGLSTSLGIVRQGSNLAFAQDLADAFRLDVTIPVGFLAGSRKHPVDEATAEVREHLHRHRLVPRMISLAESVVGA